jgi:hypothetical protein
MPLLQRRKRNVHHNVCRLRELYALLLFIVEEPQQDEDTMTRTTTTTSNVTHAMERHRTSKDVSPTRHSFRSFNDRNKKRIHPPSEEEDLWNQLSAYRQKDNNIKIRNGHCSPLTEQDEIHSQRMLQAREKESHVVELIRSIGETVIYGEQNTGDDGSHTITNTNHQVFEYFCDKNILSLLVDIFLAKPPDLPNITCVRYAGVTWTAQVKAQILQTISIFVSNLSDTTSLYYLLSNNYINTIISYMIPLEQWSDSALDEMLPVYISFLKSMALQLANKPDLFQFFVCNPSECVSSISTSTPFYLPMPLFPLFYAAVHVATSSSKIASYDYFVQTTALNIILNIFQLKNHEISSIISKSQVEQQLLIAHLCQQLKEKYHAIIDIIMIVGNRLSPWRQEALACEQGQLQDILQFITDLLWCSQSSNVTVSQRFCEGILSKVIMKPVLDNILLVSSNHDTNQKWQPEIQAKYLASLFFLSIFFNTVDYVPLLRMISVAIFHPYTPQTADLCDDAQSHSKEFCITPSLNSIAKNNFEIVQDGVLKNDTKMSMGNKSAEPEWRSSHLPVLVVSNPIQTVMYRALSGDFGDAAFVLVATVIENILQSRIMDLNMFQLFGMVTIPPSCSVLTPCLLEVSFTNFYSKLKNMPASRSGQCALNMAISVTTLLMTMQIDAWSESSNRTIADLTNLIVSNPLIQSILATKSHFASIAKDYCQNQISSELLPYLMERKLKELYSEVETNAESIQYYCNLSKLFHKSDTLLCNFVIATISGGKTNEIDEYDYAWHLMLVLDAFERNFSELYYDLSANLSDMKTRWGQDAKMFKCKASDEIMILGSLDRKSIIGSDCTIKDRTSFRFTPSLALTDHTINTSSIIKSNGAKDTRRQVADQILLMASSKSSDFLLVVYEEELLILKPDTNDTKVGTILCATLLNNIIAIASDGEWLHIAMRNVEDIGVLISKGNMALKFDSAGTCNAAKVCISNSRNLWRVNMKDKIQNFFHRCSS